MLEGVGVLARHELLRLGEASAIPLSQGRLVYSRGLGGDDAVVDCATVSYRTAGLRRSTHDARLQKGTRLSMIPVHTILIRNGTFASRVMGSQIPADRSTDVPALSDVACTKAQADQESVEQTSDILTRKVLIHWRLRGERPPGQSGDDDMVGKGSGGVRRSQQSNGWEELEEASCSLYDIVRRRSVHGVIEVSIITRPAMEKHDRDRIDPLGEDAHEMDRIHPTIVVHDRSRELRERVDALFMCAPASQS